MPASGYFSMFSNHFTWSKCCSSVCVCVPTGTDLFVPNVLVSYIADCTLRAVVLKVVPEFASIISLHLLCQFWFSWYCQNAVNTFFVTHPHLRLPTFLITHDLAIFKNVQYQHCSALLMSKQLQHVVSFDASADTLPLMHRKGKFTLTDCHTTADALSHIVYQIS